MVYKASIMVMNTVFCKRHGHIRLYSLYYGRTEGSMYTHYRHGQGIYTASILGMNIWVYIACIMGMYMEVCFRIIVMCKGVYVANIMDKDNRGQESCSWPPRRKKVLWPTQPPMQWVPGALSPGQTEQGEKLTTLVHTMPRSRKSGALPPLRNTSSWRSAQ
jgi:hypothetical protein